MADFFFIFITHTFDNMDTDVHNKLDADIVMTSELWSLCFTAVVYSNVDFHVFGLETKPDASCG